jgi:hypothetical protein
MAEKDSPAEPTIHYLLASVYRVLGNTAEASREMQTFEQLKRKGIVIGPGYFEQR